MLEAKKIVAAGHVSLDMTPAFPDFGGRANSSSDLARPGKMVNASHLAMTAGGLPLAECLGLAAAAGDVAIAAFICGALQFIFYIYRRKLKEEVRRKHGCCAKNDSCPC